jgi:hypothetical protein
MHKDDIAHSMDDDSDDYEVVSKDDDASPAWLKEAAQHMESEAQKTTENKSGTIERLVLFFAADTTGSMEGPIRYGKKIMQACMDYLAGIAESDHIDELEIVVHVVGMNDWKSHDGFSHPVKLFINEDLSINAARPVGYSFVLDKKDKAAWAAHVETVRDAIERMARSTRDGNSTGGDLREEYAAGVYLINTIVEQDKKDYPSAVTKYFLLSITDDMQHGCGPHGHGDRWSSGVSDCDVYGHNNTNAYKYACPYAPDKHATLGFNIWKPHSFWHSLNALLANGVTTVWCPIGASASYRRGSDFESWVGTLSTIFEHSNGVAISWQQGDANKPVPSTVAHLLNTLITSASISETLSEEKRKEQAISKSESLMTSAKKYSQETKGSLSQTPTNIEDAAEELDRVVVECELTDGLQNIFLGRENPDMATATPAVRVAYRSLQEARMKGDCAQADREISVAYRSLSSECAPAPASTFAAYPGAPPTVRSPLVPIDDSLPAESGVAKYRALIAPYYDGEDDDGPPCYRSLSSLPPGEPVYRGLAAAPRPPPPASPIKAKDPTASKRRLLRLSTR